MALKHEVYTVGWICPLPKEQAATLLDEYHDKLPVQRYDTTYILGRIDIHNVVLACLPSMGTNATASCAIRLRSGFKSLRFILLVGIGGGVPTRHDVRLGDVVVSVPGKSHTGVVQYDFGTKLQDEKLKIHKSQPDRLSDLLLTAVGALSTTDSQRTTENDLGHRLSQYAKGLAEKFPSMRKSCRPEVDRLFKADYRHRDDDMSCDEAHCDLSHLEERPPRAKGNVPHVHLGLIASGNEVMRDALERDRLAKELDVLCFEMEAAGLMAGIGCLVIRGICDYCDSHKNKEWQEYAAAVAAAYARELLKLVPGLQRDSRGDDAHSSGQTSFDQSKASGGQFNNISGAINVYGGKSMVGGTYSAQGDMHF